MVEIERVERLLVLVVYVEGRLSRRVNIPTRIQDDDFSFVLHIIMVKHHPPPPLVVVQQEPIFLLSSPSACVETIGAWQKLALCWGTRVLIRHYGDHLRQAGGRGDCKYCC